MLKLPFSVYDFFGYLAAGFLLCVSADFAVGKRWLLQNDLQAAQITFWIIAAYIVGHVNANFASFFLERILVGGWLKRPNEVLLRDEQPTLGRWLFRGYYTPLPKEVRDRIIRMATSRGIGDGPEELFNHVRTRAKRDATTWQNVQVFLQLYGFCRNISFALFLIAATLGFVDFMRGNDRHLALVATSLFFSTAMFYRFLKFFRQYSYELLTTYPDLPAS